ncbi:MAG: tail fiber domain-containing protein [Saprospiraceae bacterium]|nr:tail fiber domain-containing protein [Saprospiraceae bacterium]
MRKLIYSIFILLFPISIIAQSNEDSHFISSNGVIYAKNVTDDFIFGTYKLDFIAGTEKKMLFNQMKGSFRAGGVSNTAWDKVNTGSHSFAAGYNTWASGNYSTAFGSGSKATSPFSLAVGYRANANAASAIAIGRSTTASGEQSVALGYKTNATGKSSTAIGRASTASGIYSTAMGYYTMASGDYGTAMGFSTYSTGSYATSMGYLAVASGNYAFSQGFSTDATGNYSSAFGYQAKAGGDASLAVGFYTSAPSFTEVAIGTYNTIYTPVSTTDFHANDRAFVIGNGTAEKPNDAFSVFKNGHVGIGTKSPPVANLDIRQTSGNGQNPGTGGINLTNGTDHWRMYNSKNYIRYNFSSDGINYSPKAYISSSDGSWNQIADIRRLKDVKPIGTILSKIKQLNPILFHYIDNKKDTPYSFGFEANKVQSLFPNTVSHEIDETLLGIDYNKFTVISIKAIQEQQIIIDNQKAELERLKKMHESTNKELASLKNEIQEIKTQLKESN